MNIVSSFPVPVHATAADGFERSRAVPFTRMRTVQIRARRGFTLFELLIVIVLVVVFVGAIISSNDSRKCAKAKQDAEKALSDCKTVFLNPTVAAAADCIDKAQKTLTAGCTECGPPPASVTALIGELNAEINKYRDALGPADRNRITTVSSPC